MTRAWRVAALALALQGTLTGCVFGTGDDGGGGGADGGSPPEVGIACSVGTDCAGELVCDRSFPSGACTLPCGDGCPDGSACVAWGGSDLCLPACTGDADCRDGWTCSGGACVPQPTTQDGCGDVTPNGHCEGNTLVYCESLDTGVVRRVDCPTDQECTVGTDGLAECVVPGTTGCGTVSYQGYCDGDLAVWCQDAQLAERDCAAEGKTCGYVDEQVGFYCVEPATTGASRVRGTLSFAKREVTTSGLGGSSYAPVRHAVVQVRQVADDQVVAATSLSATGAFDISYQATGDVYLVFLTMASDDRYALSVRDCPTGGCTDARVYGIKSANLTPAADTDLGDLAVDDADLAGAFNILDLFVKGFDFAWENMRTKPPALTAQWAPGSDTYCSGASCFDPRSNAIYILGTSSDSDQWDDAVLAHEFGHFLESAYSRSDSPGGYHDGSPTDPRLAWGEGYGTWVGSTIAGSSVYIDTTAAGTMVIDISDTGMLANPNGGLRQDLSEFTVSELLWHLAEGGPTTPLGTEPIFDVMGLYFPTSRFVDRGVSGVDLVDLLDGWFCRGHGSQSTVRAVVNDRMGFPYDYAGPSSCP